MNESPRVVRVLFAAGMLGTSVHGLRRRTPPPSRRDLFQSPPRSPLAVPSSSKEWVGRCPFFFTDSVSRDSSLEVRSWRPCSLTATTISLGIGSSGEDLTGTVSYGPDKLPP
jgi:hypothetical protein